MTDHRDIGAVTQSLVVIPEQFVDDIDIVGQQRFLIGHENPGPSGNNIKNIDFH